jgi:peroxiredoxin
MADPEVAAAATRAGGVYLPRRHVVSVPPVAGRGLGAARRNDNPEARSMAIQVGDKIPSTTLKYLSSEGPKDITTDELFRGKKVALFAVPGAFTPTCSQRHLPGYVDKAAELKAKGVDTIACVAVNDAFVMGAWGRDQNCGDKVMMLADGSGDFTRAVGLELDARRAGLGMRSQRYSMLVEDGVVKKLNVEAPGKFEVSDADTMLKAL